MSNDKTLTALIIQIMPLMMREFQIKLDPHMLVTDQDYAAEVVRLAVSASNERLSGFAQLLQARLREMGSGPVGAARSAPTLSEPTPSSSAPAVDADVPSPSARYVRSLR